LPIEDCRLTIENGIALRRRFSIGNSQFSVSILMRRHFVPMAGFVLTGGFSVRIFANMNTAEDYEVALQRSEREV